jgi:uncharacterized protein YcbX
MQDTIAVGSVQSLWRYPVKSMRGEELEEAFVGFSGVYGDRLFAIRSANAPTAFPFLTGRNHEKLLLYRPRFRHPERAIKPPNLAEAEKVGPGLTPVVADPSDLLVDVQTPAGEVLAADDPALLRLLDEQGEAGNTLTVFRSDRAMTDCRPVSLLAVQTVRQLAEEIGVDLDKQRFRANIYVDLASGSGFGEDDLVGRNLRVGAKVVLAVLERDPRCKMISIDPDTAELNPEIQAAVSRAHDGKAGVYCAVLVEGIIRPGDLIEPFHPE